VDPAVSCVVGVPYFAFGGDPISPAAFKRCARTTRLFNTVRVRVALFWRMTHCWASLCASTRLAWGEDAGFTGWNRSWVVVPERTATCTWRTVHSLLAFLNSERWRWVGTLLPARLAQSHCRQTKRMPHCAYRTGFAAGRQMTITCRAWKAT